MLTDNPATTSILVVEDEVNHADLIQRSFEEIPGVYILEIVSSLAEARTAMERCIPHLVLTDYRLPDGDGCELIVASKGACPVIMMTSQGNEQIAVEVLKTGAQDYIVKSVETFLTLPRIAQRTLREWEMIQERKKTEDKLKKSEARFRALFSDASDGILIIDSSGRLHDVNESFARMHGYSTQEMQHFNLKDLDTPDTFRLFPERMRRILSGEKLVFELEHFHKDGHAVPFEVSSRLVSFDGDIYIQSFYRDIAERRKTEEERYNLERQFQEAQKLESLGILAGGIAHDFNNILTIILGHCYMANADIISGDEYKASFKQIEIASSRASDLCQQMLTYAGKNQLVQTNVNTRLLMDEVVKMLQAAIKKNVTIELRLECDVPEIKADSSQIQQIIMNLIINAAESIGDNNGTVRVVLEKSIIDEDLTDTDLFGTKIKSGSYACVEVTDTGCGMDENTQQRLFEPFFTTKFTGRGLGMSAVLGIIKSHQGFIQMMSKPGMGTTFKVFFPLITSTDCFKTIETEPIPFAQTNGTILLVDDEEVLRSIGVTLLKAIGFSAMTAQHGSEALEIYSERGHEIDAILLDLVMPKMGGIEAYHEVRKINLTVPIIICSGYSVDSVENLIANDEYLFFLHKPYKPEKLRNILVRIMN
ncbi:MAG: response regulator [Proteobacteria bacterium]|nr:response regulator [Pseudomonadota bacterium]